MKKTIIATGAAALLASSVAIAENFDLSNSTNLTPNVNHSTTFLGHCGACGDCGGHCGGCGGCKGDTDDTNSDQ